MLPYHDGQATSASLGTFTAHATEGNKTMLRGGLLWLLGIPIPIIIVLLLLGVI
jgi:hypothetical protein